MDQKQFRFYCQTGDLRKIREGMAKLTEEQKVDHLRVIMQSPLRSEVLEYLGIQITQLPVSVGAPLLVDLFYSEEVATRNLAVELFTAFGQEAMDVLGKHLCDLDPDVRLLTVQALIRFSSKNEALKLLREQFTVEKEMNVQSAIIEALGDLGTAVEDADAIRSYIESSNHPYIDFIGKRALLRLGIKT
jgi:HEAT repeat protein